MTVTTVRDLGARVRSARTARQMTQADLAEALHVGRDWVVRLEKGHPRLEAQKVLDALVVLGLTLEVETATPAPSLGKNATTTKASQPTTAKPTTGRQTSKNAKAKGRPLHQRPHQEASKNLTGSTVTSDDAHAPAADDPFETLFGRRP